MRLLALAPILLLSTAAAPAPTPAPDPAPLPSRVIDPTPHARADCPPISRYHAMRRGGGLKADRLGDLPMADHYKAAYRVIDGCEIPIVATFRSGGR